jgi:hexokinase
MTGNQHFYSDKRGRIRKKIDEFLSYYGMNYFDIDIQKYIGLFIQEMDKGLSGNKSSLKMLPTYIGFRKNIPPEKPVIVLDAGGTNLRSAILSFNNERKPVITDVNKTSMPGSDREISKSDFFSTIAKNIKDILGKSERIGFVFSYPIEIYPNRDGRLIKFTKEIKAPQVEGEFIGKNLMKALEDDIGLKKPEGFVLLNDTAATLLSGIPAFYNREYGSYIGFVLGTGMNACYIEKNSNIKKIASPDLNQSDYQLINIEAANFSKGPRGKIDIKFDKKTQIPGLNNYEKMFSGAYLGELILEVLKCSADENIFSKGFSEKIPYISTLGSKNIDDFLFYPPEFKPFNNLNEYMDDDDRASLFFLFDSLVERAAVLSAIVLAAVIIKTGKGRDPIRPVCIVAEGSSYYKMKDFQERIYKYLEDALSEIGNYFFELKRVDNAAMSGAAVAALLC